MIKKFTLRMAFIAVIFGFGLSNVAIAAVPVCEVAVAPIGITRTTAFSGINVKYDYATNALVPITEKGLCVSKSPVPTVSDMIFLANKPGNTLYEPILMTGLLPNTKYYVRAYAITTDYSVTPNVVAAPVYSASDISFTTSNDNIEAHWSMSTNLSSTVVGSIIAPDLNVDNIVTSVGFNQNTGGAAGTSNFIPNTPTAWAKLTTGSKLTLLQTDVPLAYIGFQITNNDTKFTINKLALSIFGYKSSNLKIQIAYSFDGFATVGDTIRNYAFNDELKTSQTASIVSLLSANNGLTSNYGKENIFSQLAIDVNSGQTISFRLYIWGKLTSGPLMRDIIVSGTKGTTAVLPTISKDDNLVIINQTNNLRIVNASEFNRFDVYSINGMLIRTVQNSSSEIIMDISGFKSGIYIMKGYSAKGIKTGKFVR